MGRRRAAYSGCPFFSVCGNLNNAAACWQRRNDLPFKAIGTWLVQTTHSCVRLNAGNLIVPLVVIAEPSQSPQLAFCCAVIGRPKKHQHMVRGKLGNGLRTCWTFIFPTDGKKFRTEVRRRATCSCSESNHRTPRSTFCIPSPSAPPPIICLHLPLSSVPAQCELEESQNACPATASTSLWESSRHQGLSVGGSCNDTMVDCDGDTGVSGDDCRGGCGAVEGGPTTTSFWESPEHEVLSISSSCDDSMVDRGGDTGVGPNGCSGGCGAVESGSRCVRRLRESVAATDSDHGVAVCQSPVREHVPPVRSYRRHCSPEEDCGTGGKESARWWAPSKNLISLSCSPPRGSRNSIQLTTPSTHRWLNRASSTFAHNPCTSFPITAHCHCLL